MLLETMGKCCHSGEKGLGECALVYNVSCDLDMEVCFLVNASWYLMIQMDKLGLLMFLIF